MFHACLLQRASAVISALLGGFGVFCVIYSFTDPQMAAQALVLLGAAFAVNYFSTHKD